jgi:hypothetical protein
MYFMRATDVKKRSMLLSACVYAEAGFVADSPYTEVNTLLLFLSALKEQSCFAVPVNFQAKACFAFSVYSVANKLVLRFLSIPTEEYFAYFRQY